MLRRLRNSRGQGNSEYVILAILVAAGVLMSTQLFGISLRCQYLSAYKEFSSGYQLPAECSERYARLIEDDDLDLEPPIDPTPPPPPPVVEPPLPPPPPPPPPDPIAPGTDHMRHHVGDGNCSAANCGGGLTNEGVSATKTFWLNVDEARAAGIQSVKVSLNVSGTDWTNNSISLGGVGLLGNLSNGYNQFIVPLDQLSGSNTLTVASASQWYSNPFAGGRFEYDDFEYWDLSVSWYP